MNDRMLRLALWCASEEFRARAAGKAPGPQPWNTELVRALELELAVSGSGRDPVAPVELSDQEDVRISCREAATILGVSKRQAQRLAADLDGQLVGGRWVFRTTTVQDYKEGRVRDRDIA